MKHIKAILGASPLGMAIPGFKDSMNNVLDSFSGDTNKSQDEKIRALEAEVAAGKKTQQQAEMEAKGTGMKKGGKVSSASKRADGCAIKGKTKGRMV